MSRSFLLGMRNVSNKSCTENQYTHFLFSNIFRKPSPAAARSKAYVCGRSPAEIVGSNPAGGMDVCLLWVLCVVRYRSLRRADPSSRGVWCVVVCDLETSWMKRPWPALGRSATRNFFFFENRADYDNVEKHYREGQATLTIWSVRIACWIPKATKSTHTQAV